MPDPLSDIIALLRPTTILAKGISAAGRWSVRYSTFGHPSFCTILEGSCRLEVDGQMPVAMEAGDFVLLPATPGFVMTGLVPAERKELVAIDPHATVGFPGEMRHGDPDGPPDVRMLGGHFAFASPDAGLLVSQLPTLIHLRGAERLTTLVHQVRDESGHDRPGRDLVLTRLIEVLLVEALRAMSGKEAPPGLLRGLADPQVAGAMRRIHDEPARPWTVATLAKDAGLSRSAFFERFARIVGLPPMEYLLGWRMNLAKDMLRRRTGKIDEIAERVGYGSASAFSTAFARQVGVPPKRFSMMAD